MPLFFDKREREGFCYMLANDFAARDGILRVHLIGHGEEPPKSDAFLLEYNGSFTLIDGGLSGCPASLEYLLNIRRKLLSEHSARQEDTNCRLRIRVMISHIAQTFSI